MQLFEEITLFDEGKCRFKDFALPDGRLQLWEQFFSRVQSDRYFQTLLAETPWAQHLRKMYDKTVPDPRLTAFYGGENGQPWTPELLEIKEQVEMKCGILFNRVLLNFYRDGNDSVSWHSDTLPAGGRHQAIASVTFGAFGDTRLFKVRHKENRRMPPIDIPLTHGSFLLMGETMQYHYEHHVPKTSRKVGRRINLTFRIA
jgi:alkylated DNA repair dioxygenase AlkB